MKSENDLSISEPQRFGMRERWLANPRMVSTTDRDQSRAPCDFYIFTVDRKFATGRLSFTKCKFMQPMVAGDFAESSRCGRGYGQEFVRSILGDYGNKDYQDLLLGVDDVLNHHPEIDPQKIHIVGGSYGGFMTNWIVEGTRIVSALPSHSGPISNWISFYGTSDIGPFS